jgi:gamma-glutamylcyclotransferase (GGCT)/AIG2-like uncharacterized protein YtfP
LTHSIFAYGTLEAPEVVALVLGRTLPGVEARLDDFARHRVRGRLFPGIVPRTEAATPGTLLREASDADLARLDSFEGALYERRRVEVTLTARTEDGRVLREEAWVYVVRREREGELSDDAWSREQFDREWLPIVLARWRS